MPEISLSEWNRFLSRYTDAHLLQTGEWGDLKASFGWEPVRITHGECGAQILYRHLPLGMTLAYIPKGPVGKPNLSFWQEVERAARQRRAVFLKMEPDAWEEDLSFSPGPRFQPSPHNIQPRRSILVNLKGSEDELLAHMKQKCRYNVRLAEKKGVTVRPWTDIEAFHKMMMITGTRDGFGSHSLEYYRQAFNLLKQAGLAELLVAEYENKPLAALIVCVRGRNSWYLYGASTDEERNRMPTYLLQWEAMRWSKGHGADVYDLWGVPDENENVLEAGFETRQDGLWGVYRFKRGFGGEVRRAAQAWDAIFHPVLYRAYLTFMRGRD